VLRGIRLEPGAVLDWPWDLGVTLAYLPGDPATAGSTMQFVTSAILPALHQQMEIVADHGDTVLARLMK
jgi:hypothetical protein